MANEGDVDALVAFECGGTDVREYELVNSFFGAVGYKDRSIAISGEKVRKKKRETNKPRSSRDSPSGNLAALPFRTGNILRANCCSRVRPLDRGKHVLTTRSL